jgi:hypothetical protein
MEETGTEGREPTLEPVTQTVTHLRKTVKKVERIGKVKTKRQAKEKIKWSLQAMAIAFKVWAEAALRNFWWKSLKSIGRFFRRIGNVIMAFFDLDSKDKVGNLIKQAKGIVRSAGNQALAASLMALLTALASGVTDAMSGLLKKGEASVLKNIVQGTMNETLSSVSQESLFRPSESPFQKASQPPWPSHNEQPSRFSDPWRKI